MLNPEDAPIFEMDEENHGFRTAERILIAGGGIGGLTAALCLAKAGFEVALFEQSAGFGELGAGFN